MVVSDHIRQEGLIHVDEQLESLTQLLGLEGWRTPAVTRHPGVVLSGDGSSSHLDEALTDWPAGTRTLIICDSQLPSLGLVSGVHKSLEHAGYHVDIYDNVLGEPTETSVDHAASHALRDAGNEYGMIVGVGGGSAMDTAKLVSAVTTTGQSLRQLIETRSSGFAPSNLILVPTTAGTGAEVSPNAILSVDTRKVVVSGPALLPAVAVLDPLLTLTMPKGATAASGIDAFCHCAETLMSTWATPMTAVRSVEGARLIASSLPAAFASPEDLSARRAMLYGSHIAGLSLGASTVLGHSMAYCVSARTGLPHGVTTGLALSYCVAYNSVAAASRLDVLARELGIAPGGLIAWISEFVAALGIPLSLRDVGIKHADLPVMVRDCMGKYPRPNNPRAFDVDGLTQLFQFAYAGDIFGYMEAQP